MTREEKKKLLAEIEKQYKWLMTKSPTIYMMDIAFDAIRKAVRDEAEQEPKISLEAYKQVAKERDIAIEQLHELGYEFGEKIPTTQERQAESDRFDAAFQDGYNNGYAQAKFDYEQEPTTKNDLGVDCISRQAVIDVITANCIWENEYNLTSSRIKKAVENLPSVTPQEPREVADYENEIADLHNRLDIAEYDKERLREEATNLDAKIKALEQEPVIDKIRDEIKQEYTKFLNKSDMWSERACGLGTALEIIDKYKAESEDK